MRCRTGSHLKNERGTSAVEFALVAMLLITLLLGITQFGITFFQWLEIVHAAREGARWASFYTNTDASVVNVVVQAAPGLSPRLSDANITISPSPRGTDDRGHPVSVTITYDSPVFTPMMRQVMGAGGPTLTLVSSATQKVE